MKYPKCHLYTLYFTFDDLIGECTIDSTSMAKAMKEVKTILKKKYKGAKIINESSK